MCCFSKPKLCFCLSPSYHEVRPQSTPLLGEILLTFLTTPSPNFVCICCTNLLRMVQPNFTNFFSRISFVTLIIFFPYKIYIFQVINLHWLLKPFLKCKLKIKQKMPHYNIGVIAIIIPYVHVQLYRMFDNLVYRMTRKKTRIKLKTASLLCVKKA